MNCFKTFSILSVLLVLFLGSINLVQAQENLRYNGPYEVGAYTGNANFQYRISNTDTIFNGDFKMQYSSLDALLKKQDTTFSFMGNFTNNYPDGNWSFQFGSFNTDSITELVGLQYQLKVSGIQEGATGKLIKGKPQGEWQYTVHQVKDSEIDQTLFKSTITFEDGIPQKSFKITTKSGTLVGRFLRNGIAHDEWVHYHENKPETSESWVFNNGLLEKVILEDDAERKEISIFDSNAPKSKTIQLDQRYLNILALKNKAIDTSIRFKAGIRAVLLQNYQYYKNIDVILNTLGEASFLPEFKVKVNHYPVSENEAKQLDSISKLVESASKLSNSFLNDTQLHILKASDEEASYLYSVLNEINNTFLEPLSQIHVYHQESIFEFVDRKKVITQLWPNGFPSKEISIPKNPNKPYLGPNAETFDFNEKSIETIQQIASYAAGSIDAIKAKLEVKLVHEKQEQELISVEEAMIAQINRLNTLIDSVGSSHPKKHINALKNIKEVANNSLGTYSNISNKEEKLVLGRQLIRCFTDLQDLENAIIKLNQQNLEIDELYQDQVWNPFMANIMTEEVKKRITSAYYKVVLPHLLESTTKNLDCSNAKSIAQLCTNTHKRIIELRDMDTRKLERKLKKEQDPTAVMQLLNIAIGTSVE